MAYTKFKNLLIDGKLKVGGDFDLGLDADRYTVKAANAKAAEDSAPTKAEFDAVVKLANELKTKLNSLAGDIAD